MKNILRILTLLIFFSNYTIAQTDKYTETLENYYIEKDFDKVIKYKKGKEKSFAAKSLYYKGMAYYMKENDRQALNYLNQAIDKGPADHDMYFYKAMTLYYTRKYEESLPVFDQAIALLPEEPEFYASKADVYYQLEQLDSALANYTKAVSIANNHAHSYFSMGAIYIELERYDEAVETFQKTLKLLEPKTERHQSCSYNIALSQQFANKLEDAEKTLKTHLVQYPNDYQTISKLIQIYYGMDQVDKTKDLKDKMLKAYEEGTLPSHLNKMYCFDQFDWGEKRVMGFVSYEDYDNEVLVWKHKFFIPDDNDEIAYKIETILDTTNLNEEQPKQYSLCLIKDDTLYTYQHFVYQPESVYADLRKAVLEILNETVQPTDKMGDYNAWLDKKRTEKFGSMGTSFETAVRVKSVSEEYQWLRDNYPGHVFTQQALVFHENLPYDILYFKTAEGVEKEAYFDISSFFGKGY